MDLPETHRVRRFRRTFSLQDYGKGSAYVRCVPSAVIEALTAPRERFELYHRTCLGRGSRGCRPPPQLTDKSTQTIPISVVSKEVQTSDPTFGQQQHSDPANHSDNRYIPFHPHFTPIIMQSLRQVTGRCPEKIITFLQKIKGEIAGQLPNAAEKPLASPSVSVSSGITPTSEGRSRVPHPVSQLAFPEPWEDRLEAPIMMCNTLGRSRGNVGQKELQRHVMSILNRVTSSTSKYRKVRDELLRLPIQEASDEILKKVVNVFFIKAVAEQRFASLYADLLVDLCAVSEGQSIGGDKKPSSKCRVRQQLLSRCQEEFRRLEEENIEIAKNGGDDRSSQSANESFTERRDKACGIVSFVGQLFLRHIVSERVIMHILVSATTGDCDVCGFVVPPRYTPSEVQMDELIKLMSVVDTAFFATSLGSGVLKTFTCIMLHWSQHHPVKRIRIVLLSLLDRLKKIMAEHGATLPQELMGKSKPHQRPGQPQPQSQQQEQPQQEKRPQLQQQGLQCQSAFEGRHPPNSLVDSLRPISSSNSGISPLCSPGVPVAVSAVGGEPAARAVAPMVVGGTPIPAPRSASNRQSSVPVTTPLTSTANASFVSKLAATTENVAAYMQNVTQLGCNLDAIVDEIVNVFENVIGVVLVWTERCLVVMKTVKERSLYGPFLCSLRQRCAEATKEELRQVAMNAFETAVRRRLYEDIPIFRYWAELVCSDATREVLDEVLLNKGLGYVMSFDSVAVRAYLRDVAAHTNEVFATPSRQLSLEKNGFVRYRPLQVILLNTASVGVEPMLTIVNYPDVRKHSTEIDLYCTLINDNPSKGAFFEGLRSSSRLESPLVAAEVFSALLHVWITSGFAHPITDDVDICVLVVDKRERATREILLLMELYFVLKNAAPPSERSNVGGEIVLRVLMNGVITNETWLRAYKYLELIEANPHHFIGVQPGSLARSDVENIKPAPNTLREKKAHLSNGSSSAVRPLYALRH